MIYESMSPDPGMVRLIAHEETWGRWVRTQQLARSREARDIYPLISKAIAESPSEIVSILVTRDEARFILGKQVV